MGNNPPQKTRSTKGNVIFSPTNSACCPKPSIAIKDVCETLDDVNTTTPVIIWSANKTGLMAVTFYVDLYTTGAAPGGFNGGANFVVTAGGVATTYSVQNGCTTTVVDYNITSITAQSFRPANPLTARICYRFYEK